MGMMVRRNIKARAEKSAPVVTKEVARPVKTVSVEENLKQRGLTKTEINRMTTAELQKFAAEIGVADATELSGNKIKKLLCEMLEG